MGVRFPSSAQSLGRLGMLNFTFASQMRVKLAKAKVAIDYGYVRRVLA
jgi:hypothetical protein